MTVQVQRLDDDLPLPAYARPGDAGADLVARESATLKANGGRAAIPTGIAIAIPDGHAGFVVPRSGLAARHGVTLVNAPGLIDPGYRGEVRVLLLNTDRQSAFRVEPGDRIAQLVIVRAERPDVVEVEALEDSRRGERGFGSTGA